MQTLEEAGFCRHCDSKVMVKKQIGTAVFGNLIMTLLTCGLWIFVWVIVSASTRLTNWRCTKCGNYAAKLI